MRQKQQQRRTQHDERRKRKKTKRNNSKISQVVATTLARDWILQINTNNRSTTIMWFPSFQHVAIAMLMVLFSSTTTTTAAASSSPTNIEDILDQLGWEGQITQMAQIDIGILLQEDRKKLDDEKVKHFIGELGIGSVLNNVGFNQESHTFWKSEDFRNAVIKIQSVAQAYGRPPVIYGLDSVHGANYIYDAIITPQPINLAATFNQSLSKQAGIWASRDTRKAGIPWLFSPLLGLAWNSFWSRVYETFGEDPLLVGDMALAMIQGIQAIVDENDDPIIPSRAAACGKHWVGYSFPHNGHDRAPSWIPKRHLYQYFLLPWRKVLQQQLSSSSEGEGDLLTIMESYTEIDGVPNVANRETLTRLLRQELQFNGMLVTDYHEIFNLYEWHHTAKDRKSALQMAIEEGSVDMSMIANEPNDFFDGMKALDSSIFQKRVRDSARRVLQLKDKLNMFEESFNMKPISDDDNQGSDKKTTGISTGDLQLALEMTHQSIILAENKNDVLPINPGDSLKILVTGPTSHSVSFQTGGWTGEWQGVNAEFENKWFTYGSTVLHAFKKETSWHVSYECGVDVYGNDCESDSEGEQSGSNQGFVDTVKGWIGWKDENYAGIDSAMNQAKEADVIVVCLGEEIYTEKPGDIRDLNLPTAQYELVAGLRAAAPTKKIILVYFGGRPRLLADVVPQVDAILLGFLPGPLAGDALVDIIAGRVNPSARLPITYPMYQDLGGVPYLHSVSDMCTRDRWTNLPCDVQWSFGHGLSYTQFTYSDLRLNTEILKHHWNDDHDTELVVTVTVTNSGNMAGAETVLFFTFDEFRSTTPEYKRLRGYEKVWLEPGQSMDVRTKIALDDFRFVGPHDDTHYILEDGMVFRVGVGSDVDCRSDSGNELCSNPIAIQTENNYEGACEAACKSWESSGCNTFTPDSCRDACSSIHNQDASGVQLNNDGWGWTYVQCIESLVWNEDFDSATDCWKLTNFCRDVLNTSGMDEFGSGKSTRNFSPIGITNAATAMSLFAGLFASVMILLAMRGRFSQDSDRSDGDLQFSPINTSEFA